MEKEQEEVRRPLENVGNNPKSTIATSSDIFDEDDVDDGTDKKQTVDEAALTHEEDEDDEVMMEDDDIKYIPAPRETHKVQIKHTERFFNARRESKIKEEEDWLAKNASHIGRRLGEKRKPGDTRDISERERFWIKGKGDDFFRAKISSLPSMPILQLSTSTKRLSLLYLIVPIVVNLIPRKRVEDCRYCWQQRYNASRT